jgi:hypothetical protein
MSKEDYSAGAVKHLFWFDEFRIIVTLLGEGKTFADIKSLSVAANIFSAPTVRRSTQIFNTVSKRVLTLDTDFYNLFETGDLQTKKHIALTAAMRYDRLLCAFTRDLYADRLASGHTTVSDKEISMFFIEKQREDDKVAAWTDYTLKKLGTTYKAMLTEAGLFSRPDTNTESRTAIPTDINTESHAAIPPEARSKLHTAPHTKDEYQLIRQLTDSRLDDLLISKNMGDIHRILSGERP